jgi:ParB family chromosome partitioning protein
MHTTLQTVQLSEISVSDLFFVTTEGRDNTSLQHSIAACGLLQPPCLWRPGDNAPYVVICGYRRLLAVRALGWRELSAWVLDPAASKASLLACSLEDNLAHRVFNPVETANALQRLVECFPRQSVISEWLPRFGLSASARVLERFLNLCVLE